MEISQKSNSPIDNKTQISASLDGTDVFVFGCGDCGQLGMGEDDLSFLVPTKNPKLGNLNITKISAGGMHTLALSKDGHIYSWGCNDEKALGHSADEFDVGCVDAKIEEKPFFVDIASGDSISASISKEGKIFAWGTFRDSKGVLGYDSSTGIREVPSLVQSLSKFNFNKIFSGPNHLFAISTDNVSYSWGCGEQGQLGRKVLERHKTLSLKPRIISPPVKRNENKELCYYIKYSCGSYHTLGLTNDGHLFSWGLNNHGQLGLGDNEDRASAELIPKEYFDGKKVVDMGAGEHHSVVLAEDGSVYTFGRGDLHQLGRGNTEPSSRPVKVSSISDVVSVASGSNHCIAVDKSGFAYVWGYGEEGQLGTGREADEKMPFKLECINGNVIQASAGGQHSVLLVGNK